MTEGTMKKYPSTVTGKTVEQKAEEKGVEYADKQKRTISIHEDSGYSWGQVEEGYENGFIDGYRECEKEWQKKADYLTGKKE